MEIPNKEVLSLHSILIHALQLKIWRLEYLLKTTNTNFDIIVISETRLLKNTKIMKNNNIPNCSYEFTPTESTAGGALLYIADHLPYQRRNDLNLYEKNYLESIFIEITNPTKRKIIVGCIYQNPTMDLNEFNC